MFGSDDQNQNPVLPASRQDNQAASVADISTQAADSTAAADAVTSSAPPTDMSTENISTESDAVVTAPSAPTIPDPMVTPSAQPDLSADLSAAASAEAGAPAKEEAGINGVPQQSVYSESTTQIGPAKPSEPQSVPAAGATVDPDLAQIKQQALQNLGPLVGQLDQAPEEKFKTVMMLVQASDNSKMLKDAYEAANQITDEKTRAQALLDIVNEINYFTAQAQAKTAQ